ncbi:precorrin-6y C5,15-methyltransferase (decarboxylating) subunit CbiE [Halocella sp. SP3-1]|uniref:precorrin-6y C5,15-methyltransferase (decarboxylating) subunit CbiE n=1 Tax=Halocella sp. SP3-1 TaxID=2382161 RepID=UPI000F74E00A|nr:precorrin-6y C5,15-methyltransferase (decarboxylating) subunit CbiE [Halocella sp. SP3-1]AZO95930.1 precorrin-6y C5,15-methyltransferase (decarboxylating) subunit CbiE [Halocella sp. SP3-1]
MNKIYVLGIGPGHRDYLLKITKDIIASSDVLIAGKRALEMFAELDKEKILITAELEKVRDYILANYQKKRISVLVSGDPGLYSMMNYLKKEIAQELLEIIPGISSLQLASARIKLNWDDLKISSLHGKDDREKFLREVRTNDKVGLFTDDKFSPNQICSFLLKQGIANKEVIVFENLSYPEERIVRGSLQELTEYSFAKLTVMVILNGEMGV